MKTDLIDSDGYWKNTARKKKVLRRARIAVSALKPYFKREPEPISVINQALEKAAEILANFKGAPDSTKLEEWQACYARLFTQMNDLVQSTKPVSSPVSLEKCAKAIYCVTRRTTNYPQIFSWDEQKYENKSLFYIEAKAVLDAVGVKYVE